MELERIKELLSKIQSLYDCYLNLDNLLIYSTVNKDKMAFKEGKWAIATKLHEILNSDPIYSIIAQDNPFPLEDFYYYLQQDVTTYIDKIRRYINSQ